MPYHLDLSRAATPSYDIWACRLSDFESETFDFHFLDLSGAILEFYISETPDAQNRLVSFVPSYQVQTTSYQSLIDECRFELDWIPCGETATDELTTSIVNISSAQSALSSLPRAEIKGEVVELFYCLRQTDPVEQVIMAGRFYLTETAS